MASVLSTWNATWFMPGRNREWSIPGTMSGEDSITMPVPSWRQTRPCSQRRAGS